MPSILHLKSFGLLGVGLIVCGFTAKSVVYDRELAAPLNPLGICTSPYGEVFAMAMQAPVDTFWHERDSHTHIADHVHDETCNHDHAEDMETARLPLRERLRSFLEKASAEVKERTNNHAPSPALDFYIRRQIEDKLRFAYHLDPSHYSNYNIYHFFLTQNTLGTRPHLTPEAAGLSEKTIQYCLREQNDPRPALTAAGATCNILELMFNDLATKTPRFTFEQAKEQLKLLEFCISRHRQLSDRWTKTGNWALVSPLRIQECEYRLTFLVKMQQTAQATLKRLETKDKFPAIHPPMIFPGSLEP